MNRPADTDHTWFRRRLPDHLLDLLVEDERERFEQHARACEPCARLLTSAKEARADWWDGTGHPPVGVLLKWTPKVRGDRVQELAHAHIAHCESCRQDVGDLLGIPTPRVPKPAPVPLWRSIPVLSRGLAMAAGLVAVAAVTHVIMQRNDTRTSAPDSIKVPSPSSTSATIGGTTSSDSGPTSSTSTAHPTAGRTAAPVTLLSPDRGADAARTLVRVVSGFTQVPLTLPMLDVPDRTRMRIELLDDAGVSVWKQDLASEQALRTGGVMLPVKGLAAGSYQLVVRWTDTALRKMKREFALDVRTSP